MSSAFLNGGVNNKVKFLYQGFFVGTGMGVGVCVGTAFVRGAGLFSLRGSSLRGDLYGGEKFEGKGNIFPFPSNFSPS